VFGGTGGGINEVELNEEKDTWKVEVMPSTLEAEVKAEEREADRKDEMLLDLDEKGQGTKEWVDEESREIRSGEEEKRKKEQEKEKKREQVRKGLIVTKFGILV
jgi:hypothetical protein